MVTTHTRRTIRPQLDVKGAAMATSGGIRGGITSFTTGTKAFLDDRPSDSTAHGFVAKVTATGTGRRVRR